MIVWLIPAAFADCPAEVTTAGTVVDHAEQGTLAYVQLEEQEFKAQVAEAVAAVRCLGEPLMPEDAAALHRARALLAYADGDEETALGAYRSALRLQPMFRLASSLAPPDGPIAALYERASVSAAPDTYMLPEPDEGQVYVDGTRELTAPDGLASVVQVVRADGSVHWSELVSAQIDLPDWFFTGTPAPAPAPAPAPVPMPQPEPLAALPPPMPVPVDRRSGSSARTGLLFGAAASGIVSAGLFAGSSQFRKAYDAEPTTAGRQRTNMLYVGSVGFGVATLGLGVAAVVAPGG